jgi:putative transcription antitermination factor YqgF
MISNFLPTTSNFPPMISNFQPTFPPTTLGIDYGSKRIGLAISRASLVEPVKVVFQPKVHTKESIQQVLEEIKAFCDRERVAQILVGISEGEMAQKSKDFGQRLHDFTQLPVLYADETLSSHEVESKIKQLKKKKRSGYIDHFAATEILERYIEDFQSGLE